MEDDQVSQRSIEQHSELTQTSNKSQKGQETYSAYELGKMILKSDTLTKDIQKTKQVPKIYTTEQVKELDDVSMIEALQQKQRELYENVNVGSKLETVLKYQEANLKKIEPGNLAKLVGQAVVAQDIQNQTLQAEHIHDDEAHESVELQTDNQSEYGMTKLDMTGSGAETQELRAFKVSDFLKMHEAQQEVLGKLPVVEHHANNFASKSNTKQNIAQNQLLKEYLQTYPASLVTHISDYQEFKKMIQNGSLLNYYDIETVVSLIQNKLADSERIGPEFQNTLDFGSSSDFKFQQLQSQTVSNDVYGKLYRDIKQKFSNPFIYDKDCVRRSTDYQIDVRIDEKEALQRLESSDGFAPSENTTIFVDELAKIAKKYGDGFGTFLDKVEADLQFRRQCALGIIRGNRQYEKAMKKKASELASDEESQILKMSLQQNDPPIDYEMEMRLQDLPEAHVQFLEDILLKYIAEDAEQSVDVRKKLALQAIKSQYDQQLFRNPTEYLEYIVGPVLDEDLVELNVSFDPDPQLQPILNPELEYFYAEKEESKHTQTSKRIARFFSGKKIPLTKQLELFEIATENMDKIEQIGEKLKEINENPDEKTKNAAIMWFLKYLNIDIAEWIKVAEQQAEEDAMRSSKLTMSNRVGTALQLDASSTNIFGGVGTPRSQDLMKQ